MPGVNCLLKKTSIGVVFLCTPIQAIILPIIPSPLESKPFLTLARLMGVLGRTPCEISGLCYDLSSEKTT